MKKFDDPGGAKGIKNIFYPAYKMTPKTEPTALIKNIKLGQKDANGHTILDVLARGNEYAIYEIEAKDINNKLRVFIDGIDDESETKIIKAFLEVKDQYINAKGLLYRSTNFGLMKNRVAHTLATALSGNVELAKTQLIKLIDDINNEYEETYIRRAFYVFPGYILLLILIILWLNPYFNIKSISGEVSEWLKIIFSGVIGGVFSMTFNIKNHRFDAEIGKFIYVIFGLERIILAILAGVICAIGIKSKFIFANISTSPTEMWSLIFLVIVASFSEQLIPNIIGKYEKKSK